MAKRDEFSEETKAVLAKRASWHCSFPTCDVLTVGPSSESPTSVNMIGKAAHICGASKGRGSRRYDSNMTPDQRKSFDNGIWMCATHADMIDRDESIFTAAQLRSMKADHEARCQARMYGTGSIGLHRGLLAVGRDIVCTAEIRSITKSTWIFGLHDFIVGDSPRLISRIPGISGLPTADRYVLSGEIGDGRVLIDAPQLRVVDGKAELTCMVQPRAARIDARSLGSMAAMHPETRDMYAEHGQIARVSGIAALKQFVEQALSMQQGEAFFDLSAGVRFFEYAQGFAGSALLPELLTLDVIRQASIPASGQTPLRCVVQVRRLSLPSGIGSERRFRLDVDLEINGVGTWQSELSIYMPTAQEMADVRARAEERSRQVGPLAVAPAAHVERLPVSSSVAAKILETLKRPKH